MSRRFWSSIVIGSVGSELTMWRQPLVLGQEVSLSGWLRSTRAEVDDDLVRDITELLTSVCERLYGRRSASKKA